MDDASRNEICVFKTSIVRSLASFGMTVITPRLIMRGAFQSFHLGIVLQSCYGFQSNDERARRRTDGPSPNRNTQ
jgi:hypothetical protein